MALLVLSTYTVHLNNFARSLITNLNTVIASAVWFYWRPDRSLHSRLTHRRRRLCQVTPRHVPNHVPNSAILTYANCTQPHSNARV
jgi:hypothetical protein